ncbi:MAG TPA: peptidylprolyl isomerase [Phycisphaerae bacterium]|jgi:hypothetical protein|nr:hypothetical protein [Phycisphaerae bacterium]HOB75458.1 peptidylprolyl isomerase [Phycisphaerae bacterium]HOJ55318.1 peptidylprolyl isomerase [Phycisphaerae bacterium]HOL27394.1 peptidylprolyl isomerase [Phycisphaerae bacterium]HPP21621.1 peptidylprolyl isomerase [Phycisphaerae bacterium]
MMRQGLVVSWSMAGALLAGAWVVSVATAQQPTTAPGASAVAETRPAGTAATQPAHDAVLVLIGDKTAITQAEFERYFYGGAPADFHANKEQFMRELVERRWLLIYLDENPELVPESVIQAQKEHIKKREKLNTDEEFTAFLKKVGRTPESWRMQVLLANGRTALSNRGREKAKNADLLKKLYDDNPADFNGTEVSARHILIGSAPYDTPAEREAKRQKALKLREDLVGGKITWDEALKQSTCPTRLNGGKLGYFTRHHRMMEPLAEAAFKVKPGQVGEVLETFMGFHIIEVLDRHEGRRRFEDSKGDIKLWLEREPYLNAILEMSRKYPAIGVQPPYEPPPRRVTTRPSPLGRPTATRPAGRLSPRLGTRPSGLHITPRK